MAEFNRHRVYPSAQAGGALTYVSSHHFEAGEATLNAGLAGASAVWPAANRIIYIPFVVDRLVTAYQIDTFNGATAAGNTDVGIYSWGGKRLVSSGATAQAGINTPQVFNTTDTILYVGRYYMALSQSLGTSTFFRTALSQLNLQACGVKQEAGSGSLPATATFAAPATAYLPLMAVYFTSTAI